MDKKIVALGLGIVILSALLLSGTAQARSWHIDIVNNNLPEKNNIYYTLVNERIYFGYTTDIGGDPSGLVRYSIPIDDLTKLNEVSAQRMSAWGGFYNQSTDYLWLSGNWLSDSSDYNTVSKFIARWDNDLWTFDKAVYPDSGNQSFSFTSLVEKNSSYLMAGTGGRKWSVAGNDGILTWHEGGEVWLIPKATFTNTSTWTKIWQEPDEFAIPNLYNYNGDIYALAINASRTPSSVPNRATYSDFKIYKWNVTGQTFDLKFEQPDDSQDVLPTHFFTDNGRLYLLYGKPSFGKVLLLWTTDGENWYQKNTKVSYVQDTNRLDSGNDARIGGYIGFEGRHQEGSVYEAYGDTFRVHRFNLTTEQTFTVREFSGSGFSQNPDNGWGTWKGETSYYFIVTTDSGANKIMVEGYLNDSKVVVHAKDEKTKETIPNFQATLNGRVKNTTTGTITFYDVPDGQHKLKVISDNHYVKETYVTTDWASTTNHTTSETVYLTSYPEGAGSQYAPHYVEFKVLMTSWLIFSDPVPNVTVNVSGIGKNQSNISMNGSTGSNGAVGFEMRQDIKYKLDFSKGNWSDTLTIYPTDDYYQIYVSGVTGEGQPSLRGTVNWNFSTEEINSTARYFNFSYNDTSGKTDHLGFYIYNGTKKLIYSNELTGVSSHNFSTTIKNYDGKDYYTKFNATYVDDYFKPAKGVKGYSFPKDMSFGIPQKWLNIISIALLFLTGSLFSAVTVKVGAVIVPGFAWLLHWVGWLSYTGAAILIPTAFVLGALYYMSQKEREAGI